MINLGANDTRSGFVQAGVAMIKQLRTWHPKVQVVCLRPFGGQAGEAPPQAARSALDAEHDSQADRRAKGPARPNFTHTPMVPSPAEKTGWRAQGSRGPNSTD